MKTLKRSFRLIITQSENGDLTIATKILNNGPAQEFDLFQITCNAINSHAVDTIDQVTSAAKVALCLHETQDDCEKHSPYNPKIPK